MSAETVILQTEYAHIVCMPTVMGGEPHIAGHRIRVRDIVAARDRVGFTPEEIAASAYPHLTLAQVYSALAYYEDHRQQIDSAMRSEAQLDENRLAHKLDTWFETIRDLIKHENELVAQRLGWMGAFQGLLFAALAFSWEKGGRWLSPTTVLCVMGIFLAWQSLRALLQSSTAIDRLRAEWHGHIELIIDKTDLPPVWAWRDAPGDAPENPANYHWLTKCLNLLNTPVKENPRQGWFKAPWHWVPICLLVGWGFMLGFHLTRLEPLKGQWQFLVQDELERALVHDKSDKEAQQAITRLALIHGNARHGEQVFKHVCADCHDTPSSQDQTIPSRDKLKEYDRERIVSGILYPNPNKVTRKGGRCMRDGLTTLMSPEEFVDVVEYLQPLLLKPLNPSVPP